MGLLSLQPVAANGGLRRLGARRPGLPRCTENGARPPHRSRRNPPRGRARPRGPRRRGDGEARRGLWARARRGRRREPGARGGRVARAAADRELLAMQGVVRLLGVMEGRDVSRELETLANINLLLKQRGNKALQQLA